MVARKPDYVNKKNKPRQPPYNPQVNLRGKGLELCTKKDRGDGANEHRARWLRSGRVYGRSGGNATRLGTGAPLSRVATTTTPLGPTATMAGTVAPLKPDSSNGTTGCSAVTMSGRPNSASTAGGNSFGTGMDNLLCGWENKGLGSLAGTQAIQKHLD
ncbi:MAG: hypothetical protein EXS55_02855 [Candidatus Magasanikbacteria bacterium]|nr:hypothetical protein [Candidatus Magasanikbacteria bacterium]